MSIYTIDLLPLCYICSDSVGPFTGAVGGQPLCETCFNDFMDEMAKDYQAHLKEACS